MRHCGAVRGNLAVFRRTRVGDGIANPAMHNGTWASRGAGLSALTPAAPVLFGGPRMKHSRNLILSLLCWAWSCGGTTNAANAPETSKPPETHSAPQPSASARVEPTEPVAAPEPPRAKSLFTIGEGLLVPESVLYDVERDRYLVSNINGDPTVADNNGFISEITPDGKMARAKFIAAGGKTKLNAPKGSGIYKTTLYVADINVVRSLMCKQEPRSGRSFFLEQPFSTTLRWAMTARCMSPTLD